MRYATKPDTTSDILAAWEAWVERKIDQEWKADILTFLFIPLSGSAKAKQTQMVRAIEAAYGLFVTRVVRKPRSPSQQLRLPIWLSWPDLPVFKHSSKLTSLLRPNDGLHYHALALTPPLTRLDDVGKHFMEERERYRHRCQIETIDVEPIQYDIGTAMSYLRKSIIRGRFPVGDELILPRSLSELRR